MERLNQSNTSIESCQDTELQNSIHARSLPRYSFVAVLFSAHGDCWLVRQYFGAHQASAHQPRLRRESLRHCPCFICDINVDVNIYPVFFQYSHKVSLCIVLLCFHNIAISYYKNKTHKVQLTAPLNTDSAGLSKLHGIYGVS